jgi:AcrR family transcriptional regulator
MAKEPSARRPRNSRSGGRGRLVSREQIVALAISLGDQQGLDFSVRQLAEGLNIGTMTLYSYFSSKDEILDAMADKLLGALTVPLEEGADFEEILHATAEAYRDLFRRHPSALRLLATRATGKSDVAAGGMNETLAALRSAGLDAPTAVKVMGVIVQYTLGFSTYQMARPWGWPDADPESVRVRTLRYESSNAVAFPHVVEAAAELTQLPTEAQFEFGLNAIARGLRAAVAEAAA